MVWDNACASTAQEPRECIAIADVHQFIPFLQTVDSSKYATVSQVPRDFLGDDGGFLKVADRKNEQPYFVSSTGFRKFT